jgi:hypothetical protein
MVKSNYFDIPWNFHPEGMHLTSKQLICEQRKECDCAVPAILEHMERFRLGKHHGNDQLPYISNTQKLLRHASHYVA